MRMFALGIPASWQCGGCLTLNWVFHDSVSVAQEDTPVRRPMQWLVEFGGGVIGWVRLEAILGRNYLDAGMSEAYELA